MAWFKRGTGDVGVVDIADLQRRGIYKPKSIPKKTITPTDSQGYADLSKPATQSTSTGSTASPQTTSSQTSSGGFFDFFGNLRNNNSSNSSSSSEQSTTQAVTASSSEYGSTPDHSLLKTKIDDVEFKLENINRKINNFLERIELMEKKISRLEGRGY